MSPVALVQSLGCLSKYEYLADNEDSVFTSFIRTKLELLLHVL